MTASRALFVVAAIAAICLAAFVRVGRADPPTVFEISVIGREVTPDADATIHRVTYTVRPKFPTKLTAKMGASS
jgi:hypothetical protein